MTGLAGTTGYRDEMGRVRHTRYGVCEPSCPPYCSTAFRSNKILRGGLHAAGSLKVGDRRPSRPVALVLVTSQILPPQLDRIARQRGRTCSWQKGVRGDAGGRPEVSKLANFPHSRYSSPARAI